MKKIIFSVLTFACLFAGVCFGFKSNAASVIPSGTSNNVMGGYDVKVNSGNVNYSVYSVLTFGQAADCEVTFEDLGSTTYYLYFMFSSSTSVTLVNDTRMSLYDFETISLLFNSDEITYTFAQKKIYVLGFDGTTSINFIASNTSMSMLQILAYNGAGTIYPNSFMRDKVPDVVSLWSDVYFMDLSKSSASITIAKDYFTFDTFNIGSFLKDNNFDRGNFSLILQNPIPITDNAFRIWIYDGQYFFVDNNYVVVDSSSGTIESNFKFISGSITGLGLWEFIPGSTSGLNITSILFQNVSITGGYYPDSIVLSTSNYLLGYSVGYTQGYEVGESAGFTSGYDTGVGFGREQGYESGYLEGYGVGYSDGSGSDNTLVGMMFAVVDAPFQILKESLNFTFLGVNIADFIFSFITLIIVIRILKLFF